MAGKSAALREFDPVRLGLYESEAWVAYYRRRWMTFLNSAVGMVRIGFRLSWPRSVRGAWYVMRANQIWAPYPDHDEGAAIEQMRRFYAFVARTHNVALDARIAAELEIAWWRAHREHQHSGEFPDAADPGSLVAALAALYAHVYAVPVDTVIPAAAARAEAMDISDRWVAQGRDPASPLIDAERRALIRGYVELSAAVQAPSDRAASP